jgi:hypothetical protein
MLEFTFLLVFELGVTLEFTTGVVFTGAGVVLKDIILFLLIKVRK